MSDDKIPATNATISFDDGDEVEPITDCSISIDSDVSVRESTVPDTFDGEYLCSFTVEIESQTVVCPDCNVANHLPNSDFLGALTREPVGCVFCGYPLL